MSNSKAMKTYTFTFTTANFVWLSVALGLALSVFFFFGVLVGRGYVPAPLEPQKATNASVVQVQTVEVETPEVLAPEELEYPERLGQVAPDAPAENVQAGNETARTAEPANAEETTSGEMHQLHVPGEQSYAYIFQAAAFRDSNQAEDLARTFAGKGLNAEVVQGVVNDNTWYRVRIKFTGPEAQAGSVIDIITNTTGQKPHRVSKDKVE